MDVHVNVHVLATQLKTLEVHVLKESTVHVHVDRVKQILHMY